MATQAVLTKTAATFGTFKESWPKKIRLKRPEVDVVLSRKAYMTPYVYAIFLLFFLTYDLD